MCAPLALVLNFLHAKQYHLIVRRQPTQARNNRDSQREKTPRTEYFEQIKQIHAKQCQ